MEKKKVTILLSRYRDPFSKIIALNSCGIFTHCSISVDPEENHFYSFNKKGFVEEFWKNKKSRYLMPEKHYLHLYVEEPVFEKIKAEIERFKEKRQEMTYSVFGTFLCMMHIPHHFKRRYFCSRFVAEVLQNSGAVKLKKKCSLYLPMHFLKELKTVS